jgi:uncharacterized surface protein with fasciclin (FAS1) repeats
MTQQLSWKFLKEKAGHYWEVYNEQGDVVGRSSQYFAGRSGAHYNAHLLGHEGQYSKAVDWQFEKNKQGDWEWQAFSTNNFEEIGASHTSYDSEIEAKENAALFGYPMVNPIQGAMSMRWLWWLIAALALLGVVLFWPQITSWLGGNKPQTITLNSQLNTNDTSKFLDLVKTAGLESSLNGNEKLTVFAPNNSAIAQLASADVTKLVGLPNRQVLQDLLNCHIFKGELTSDKLTDGLKITTLNGKESMITKKDNITLIDGVEVLTSGKTAENGVVYTIASVLHTDGLAAKLVEVSVPSSSSSSSEVALSSESSSVAASSSSSSQEIVKPSNVVSLLIGDSRFTTLLAAIDASGLRSTLETTNLTLFAPTNDAFARLPAGELDRLLKPENKPELANLLRYHVLKGSIESPALANVTQLSSLLGSVIYVVQEEGEPHLVTNQDEHTHITQADLLTQNGVVHIVDQVLIPFLSK